MGKCFQAIGIILQLVALFGTGGGVEWKELGVILFLTCATMEKMDGNEIITSDSQ